MQLNQLVGSIECFCNDPNSTCHNKVEMAQKLIQTAINLLDKVAQKTNDGNADAYIVAKLKILVGKEHGYMTMDTNLDEWLDRLEEDPPEELEEEEQDPE